MIMSRFCLAPYVFIIASLLLLADPAVAQDAEPAALCENAIIEGARTGGVPQDVLHAISLTETGRVDGGRLRPWPWAVNLEGQGNWFRTRDEALAFARRSLAEGRRSFDVGCFQINYKYHGHNFPSLEAMFDPLQGAAYAARFLGDLFLESGDWSVAAGAYHSRTPHYAGIYRARFDRLFETAAATPLMMVEVAGAAEPVKTGRSRTKMTRGPLIIRIEPRRPDDGQDPTAGGRMAELKTERLEKGLRTTASTDAKTAEPEAENAKSPAGDWQAASGFASSGPR